MFLFLRLLLAHCIGDFPLQVDEVVRQKHQGFRGHLLHGGIVGATYLVFSAPFLGHPSLWAFIVFLCVSHIFLDWLKIRVEKNIGSGFWTFVVDQFLHVAALCPVFLFGYSNHSPSAGNAWWAAYNDTGLVVGLICYICATFAGTYLLYFFKKTFFPLFANIPVPRSINYGLFERGFIMSVVCFLPFMWYVLIALLCVADVVRGKKQGAVGFIINCVYAAGWGLALKAALA